jgi:hypothetical protein
MDGNRQSTDNPFTETSEDRLEREMKNNNHILFQIEQRLEDISNKLEINTANVDLLEEAMATFTDIPTRPVRLSYSHHENKLRINSRFYIPFEGREAEILSVMFFKKSGLPKNRKFQCSEVAEELSDSISGKSVTQKAVSSAATRIETKLNTRLNTKNLFVVNTKEFYFSKITD